MVLEMCFSELGSLTECVSMIVKVIKIIGDIIRLMLDIYFVNVK